MDQMHYLLKGFISYIFFMTLLFGNVISKDLVEKKWIKISPLREFSISGVAPFYNNFIIVHDNKKANQARVSMLDQKNNLILLGWPELKLPFDLEAIHLIPGTKNEFLIMESRGYCYRISINSKTNIIEILNKFKLPKLTKKMNLEGLALHKYSNSKNDLIKIIYGDRGSNTRESTLFVGNYDFVKGIVTNIELFQFSVKEPVSHRRNISDLAIDKNNNLWCSATSDPSNDGPFETKLYIIGRLNNNGYFNMKKNLIVARSIDKQKIEAITFHKSRLLLMTDNEKKGSTVNSFNVMD
jgi:hypothetical protein|tara:strand:+ start:4665 stop:5555 length:891 start_codon:yes stop_codon:yes gene_type:complete